MLIEFRVTNYRSIAETQTLSMAANSDDTHQDTNCFESGISVAPKLLHSAVAYGPNASGKSTLISALAFMRIFVETSATQTREGQLLTFSPFRFESKYQTEPTEFEATFIEQGIRYQYGFAFNAERITSEWLFAYIGKKPQRWFEREYDSKIKKDKFSFSSYFPPKNGLRLLWEKSTRSNALFLSTAINLNSEQLRPIFHWFVDKLVVVQAGMPTPISLSSTIKYINKGNFEKEAVLKFLQEADFGITDIKIKKEKGHQVTLRIEQAKAPIQTVEAADIPMISFSHQVKNNSTDFMFHEESTGTQRWFSFTGPILDVLERGCVLVIDELDTSLHVLLGRFFINLFHNPKLNKNKAQLIFSTHNTALLDKELFRRDQVWFLEKNNHGASQLYPLTDFSPRKDEALEKGYLAGRYGALPFLGEINFSEDK